MKNKKKQKQIVLTPIVQETNDIEHYLKDKKLREDTEETLKNLKAIEEEWNAELKELKELKFKYKQALMYAQSFASDMGELRDRIKGE